MKINNKKILFALMLTPTMLLGSCGGGNDGGSKTPTSNTPTESTTDSTATGTKETVKIWCSEVEGVATSFKAIADKWAADNNLNYEFTVTGITEADQATQMLTDVSAGADIFCFAQDQFARLVQGGALSALGPSASEWVKTNNDEGSVRAVTSGDSVYAYPLTSDNGYFMYYDKSVVNEKHIDSLEDLVDDCEKAGKNFSFELGGSGWYTASFFMAYDEDGKQLCHSNWTTNNEGAFTAVDDTWDSDNGVIAAKGMQHLVKSDNWCDSSAQGDFKAATPSGVLISGTWAYTAVKEALGDNMGVADLPSFKVDNKSYHLGSYSGYKLLGVKPQTDAVRASNLNKLARVLTGYEAEMSRLNTFGWGPSNKEAQASDAFKANPALAALAAQSQYSTAQGQIHGSWWDISKVVGTSLKKAGTDDDSIKAVLKTYSTALEGILNASDEVKRAFTVIGKISSLSYNWDTDIAMKEDPTNTWTSEPITLTEGDEFKVRQGKGWDVAFGGSSIGQTSDNVVVTAEQAGSKKIQLVTTVDADGKVTNGTISLIAA